MIAVKCKEEIGYDGRWAGSEGKYRQPPNHGGVAPLDTWSPLKARIAADVTNVAKVIMFLPCFKPINSFLL